MLRRLAHAVLVTLVVVMVAGSALQAAAEPFASLLQIQSFSADLGLVQLEISL